MDKQIAALLIAASLCLAACGGGVDAGVEITFDAELEISGNLVILSGKSYVPEGSTCPNSGEYVRSGTLGTHQITWRNAATGLSGTGSAEPWICNAEDGRVTSWRSIAPVSLAPGDNTITATMTSSGRSSSASMTLRPAT